MYKISSIKNELYTEDTEDTDLEQFKVWTQIGLGGHCLIREDVSPNWVLEIAEQTARYPRVRENADPGAGETGEISDDPQRLGRYQKRVMHELRGLLIRYRCSA